MSIVRAESFVTIPLMSPSWSWRSRWSADALDHAEETDARRVDLEQALDRGLEVACLDRGAVRVLQAVTKLEAQLRAVGGNLRHALCEIRLERCAVRAGDVLVPQQALVDVPVDLPGGHRVGEPRVHVVGCIPDDVQLLIGLATAAGVPPEDDFFPPPPHPAARTARAATSVNIPNARNNFNLLLTMELLPLVCHGRAGLSPLARSRIADSYRRLLGYAVSTCGIYRRISRRR